MTVLAFIIGVAAGYVAQDFITEGIEYVEHKYAEFKNRNKG